MTFSVLHMKDNRPLIEPTVDHSGSHVKWNVTSLSPVGPIIRKSQAVEHHGVVLVYKQLGSDSNNYSFHVYLATNSSSDIKVFVAVWVPFANMSCKIIRPAVVFGMALFGNVVKFLRTFCSFRILFIFLCINNAVIGSSFQTGCLIYKCSFISHLF